MGVFVHFIKVVDKCLVPKPTAFEAKQVAFQFITEWPCDPGQNFGFSMTQSVHVQTGIRTRVSQGDISKAHSAGLGFWCLEDQQRKFTFPFPQTFASRKQRKEIDREEGLGG